MMTKPSFVGFQEKIDIPEGFELLEIKERVESSKSREELFSYLSQPELLSQWFYEVRSLDSRPGGKVSFISDDGGQLQATCTSVDLGKEISFIEDTFGNFTARIIKSHSAYAIEIEFKILTNAPEEKKRRILASIEKLRGISA